MIGKMPRKSSVLRVVAGSPWASSVRGTTTAAAPARLSISRRVSVFMFWSLTFNAALSLRWSGRNSHFDEQIRHRLPGIHERLMRNVRRNVEDVARGCLVGRPAFEGRVPRTSPDDFAADDDAARSALDDPHVGLT